MSPTRQLIKIKSNDLKRTLVRGLGRSAWEKFQLLSAQERRHANLKKKTPRHKKSLFEEYE